MNISDTTNGFFYSQTYGKVNIYEMSQKIREFMESEINKEYCLVIGSDSQEKNGNLKIEKYVIIVTAVTIHRKGTGGIYFYKKKKLDNIKGLRNNLRNKIYAETMSSLTFAEEFIPVLKENLNGHSPKLEIHVDVGEYGESRGTIKEVVGMVTGSGYIAKTKPFSYGASKVADRHTK
ncbi:MAG: ribonuclease H-like YkuK family protein [Candidatus Levyibacteriota bacterium]